MKKEINAKYYLIKSQDIIWKLVLIEKCKYYVFVYTIDFSLHITTPYVEINLKTVF